MSKFYFYTDINQVSAQAAADAFGPDPSNPTTRFNISNKFSGTDARAYAVCDGDIVLIDDVIDDQNQVIPDQINLVLKPFHQPKQDLGHILVYVYRGIKKSSLIDTTASPAIIKPYDNNVATEKIKLRKIIYDNYQRLLNQPNSTYPPDPEARMFFANESAGSATPLIKSFYKTGESQFQRVKAGDVIGIFDSVFGFDIVVEEIGYDPDVAFARKSHFYIDVSTYQSTPQATRFQNNNAREVILRYIDPCAFFGSFYHHKLFLQTTDSQTGNDSDEKLTDQEVYEKLLEGPSQNHYFFNRNVIYLDIRNELNYSIDYFENYGTNSGRNIFLSFDNTTLPAAVDYYNELWPLKRIFLSDFVGGNPNNTGNENQFYLNFPKGDNALPILFVSQGDIEISENFFEKIKKRKKRFLPLFYYQDPNSLNAPTFTSIVDDQQKSLCFIVPNYQANSQTEPISTYVRLKYLKTITYYPEPESSGTVLRAVRPLDHIFQPHLMKTRLDAGISSQMNSSVFNQEIAVDHLSESNQYYMADVGMIQNENGSVTLFSGAKEKYIANRNKISKSLGLRSFFGSSHNGSSTSALVNSLDSISWTEVELTEEPLDSSGNYYKMEMIGLNSDVANRITHDPLDFVSVTFNSDEYASILYAVQNNDFLPDFRIALARKSVYSGTHQFQPVGTSITQNLVFIKFEYLLRGYSINSSGDIEVLEVSIPQLSNNSPVTGSKLFKYVAANKYLRISAQDAPVSRGNIVPRIGQFINALDGLKTKPKLLSGKSYEVENVGTDYYIKTTLYMKQGSGLAEDDFRTLCIYAAKNISLVWNSTTNSGLPSMEDQFVNVIDPENPAWIGGTAMTLHAIVVLRQTDGALIDPFTMQPFTGNAARTIIIDMNTPAHKSKRSLHDNEVLIDTENDIVGVSYIEENQKVGKFYYGNYYARERALYDTPEVYMPITENTYAHEFGHVLGLADRYVYVMALKYNQSNRLYVDASFTSSGRALTSFTAPLDPLYDPEYGVQYRWRHNLMSTVTSVRPNDGVHHYVDPITLNDPNNPNDDSFVDNASYFYESTAAERGSANGHAYDELYNTLRPIADQSQTGEYLKPLRYNTVCLFITQQQWKIIKNNGREGDQSNSDLRLRFPKKFAFILGTDGPHQELPIIT